MRALIVASLIALACACAGPPARVERHQEVDLPSDWQAEPGRDLRVSTTWWHEIGDGRFVPLVEEALANNPDLRVTAARLSEARAVAELVGADLLPRLDGSFGASRRKNNFIGLPVPGGGVQSARFSSYSLSLATSWEVDLWGRLEALADAAVVQVDAAAADLEGARLSLIAATLRAAFALLEAQEQLALSERTLANWIENDSFVERRYRSGLNSALARRQTASNLAGAAARVEADRRNLADASRSLAVLLGRVPDDGLELGQGFPQLEEAVPAGLPTTLLSRRADLAAAERRLFSSVLDVEAARLAYYPQFVLTGALGTSSDQLSDLLDSDFGVWSIGGELLQPIFEGGRLRAGVEREEAQADADLARFTSTMLNALREVESALAAERWLALVEEQIATASSEANGARDLATQRYSRGLTELLTVLDTQRTAQAAESELIRVRRERLDNRVALYLALGGGFDAERDLGAARERWREHLEHDDPPSDDDGATAADDAPGDAGAPDGTDP